jgi:OOP family OmpA-OmpF porin
VLFDFDKAVIKSTFMLDEAITLLKGNPEINVEIQGHTDNVGDPAYNVNLSQRRADAVMEYMIANGVSSSRLRAKGYGDTRPHESNASEKGRALNRRVELHPYR